MPQFVKCPSRSRRRRVAQLLSLALASLAAAAATAPPAAPAALPDGRVYELVSPANKHGNQAGASAYAATNMAAVSEDGQAVAYGNTGLIGDTDRGVQYFTVGRRTPSGWTAGNPINGPDPSIGIQYINAMPGTVVFARDLSRLMFDSPGSYGPPNPYSQTLARSGGVYLTQPPAVPKWISQPSWAEATPKPGALTNETSPTPIGGSPDLSVVYFSYCGTLTPEDAPRSGREAQGYYEYRDGRLSVAGVLPDGTVDPSGASPANRVVPCNDIDGPHFGTDQYVDRNPVSDDGERAFFVSPSPIADDTRPRQLYVRIGGQRSVLVSESELTGEAAATGTVPIERPVNERGPYAVASPNGGTVLFASHDRLTHDAPADDAVKRYAYDVDEQDLRYLPTTTGKIYAVTDGGRTIVSQDESFDGGQLAIKTLKVQYGEETHVIGSYRGGTETSPDATMLGLQLVDGDETLVFQAPHSLSGGQGTQQVYRWTKGDDAPQCISCPASGVGAGDAFVSRLNTGGGAPAPVKDVRNVSPDGRRIVFESPEALIEEDTNGKRDVYQWSDGRLDLISSGTSEADSYVIASSPSGDDVFFATSEQLVPEDTDDAYDVYDARVGGGFPPVEAPRSCTGDDCRGPAAGGPSAPQPGSSAVSGPGNVVVPPTPDRPQTAAGRVRVSRSSGARGRVTLRVATPAAGRIAVSGAGLRAVRRTAKRKATYTVTVRLSRSARRALLRRGTRKVRVRVRFTPAGTSSSSTTTVSLTVRK